MSEKWETPWVVRPHMTGISWTVGPEVDVPGVTDVPGITKGTGLKGQYIVAIVKDREEYANLIALAPELVEALKNLVSAIDSLAAESEGVTGLHLNGDVAKWEDILPGGQYEAWLLPIDSARALLARVEGGGK